MAGLSRTFSSLSLCASYVPTSFCVGAAPLRFLAEDDFEVLASNCLVDTSTPCIPKSCVLGHQEASSTLLTVGKQTSPAFSTATPVVSSATFIVPNNRSLNDTIPHNLSLPPFNITLPTQPVKDTSRSAVSPTIKNGAWSMSLEVLLMILFGMIGITAAVLHAVLYKPIEEPNQEGRHYVPSKFSPES
jgi:hypothetical protein